MVSIFPSDRKKKYPYLKANAEWYMVFLTDMVTIPFVPILARMYPFISPNGISLASFIVFYAALTVMFIYPQKAVIYTLGFYFSAFLDDIDGKVARVLGIKNEKGNIVDALCDMMTHGLGLALVGLALSVKTYSWAPFFIILPYALYMANYHVNYVIQGINNAPATASPSSGKWEEFCNQRGLCYDPYTHSEIIFISILLIAINLPEPSIFLFLAIYSKFIFLILTRRK